MFHSLDTTTWLSAVSRRKLQSVGSPDRERPRDADKLLRKVLLRNSLSRVDLALAEAQSLPALSPPSSPTLPSPQQRPCLSHSDPEPSASSSKADEDDFVFPDATSITTSRAYSQEDADAEAKWLDSLLDDLSDDDEYENEAEQGPANSSQTFEDEDDEELYLDPESLPWLHSTDAEEPISAPPPIPANDSTVLDHLEPFYYPLPEDDDDLSTVPTMDDDVEGESEADSVEWLATPGHRSLTSMLGHSSNLHHLVASGNQHENSPLSPITVNVIDEHDVRPAIHVEEPNLYRYSPAPSERPLGSSTTTALGSAC
ncbi:hypothetical protein CPB86DRAFT_773867 [Serendipita vermifera]|nr:hypothetical protein CPB86DRAFT_773867 [Serendipita vermifera]